MGRDDLFRLDLLGSFRLTAPDGARILVRAKRSRILLAMLATSRSGERSRRWLQEHIWGSRERNHAQASLRRELSNLRQLLNGGDRPLLIFAHDAVAIDLSRVVIDVRNPDDLEQVTDEFLEGIDIAGEESFEEWLREERQSIEAVREAAGNARRMSVAG